MAGLFTLGYGGLQNRTIGVEELVWRLATERGKDSGYAYRIGERAGTAS